MSPHAAHYEDIPVDEYFDKGVHRSPAEYFDSNGEFSLSFIEFGPGQGGNLHYHEAPVEEFYFVLSGKLDVRVGDEVVNAEAGTMIYTPPETLQQPFNNYDEPAELFVIRGPGLEGKVQTVTEGAWTPP